MAEALEPLVQAGAIGVLLASLWGIWKLLMRLIERLENESSTRIAAERAREEAYHRLIRDILNLPQPPDQP